MKTWAFSRSTSDVSAAVTDDAWAPTPAPMNAWLLLTGVYDANAGTISLYFNGTLQKTVPTRTAPWASSGPFEVGRSWYNSYPSNPFTGGVSDVRVYNRALTAPEVQSLTHA
jgi:hypothetical protein